MPCGFHDAVSLTRVCLSGNKMRSELATQGGAASGKQGKRTLGDRLNIVHQALGATLMGQAGTERFVPGHWP
jgi:hypothetical protein